MSDLEIERQNLLIYLQEYCEAAEIEWNDCYLNPKDYTPPFEDEFEEEKLNFHITLGKLIMLEEKFCDKFADLLTVSTDDMLLIS